MTEITNHSDSGTSAIDEMRCHHQWSTPSLAEPSPIARPNGDFIWGDFISGDFIWGDPVGASAMSRSLCHGPSVTGPCHGPTVTGHCDMPTTQASRVRTAVPISTA